MGGEIGLIPRITLCDVSRYLAKGIGDKRDKKYTIYNRVEFDSVCDIYSHDIRFIGIISPLSPIP